MTNFSTEDTVSVRVCAGTPALTSRQMKEAEMEQVAAFLDKGVELAAEIKATIKKDTGKNVSYKVGPVVGS